MSFTEVLKRKDDAVFRRFGEDATYISRYGQIIEGVRVIRKRPDDIVRFADSQLITPSCILRFRRSEIATAEGGDRVVFLNDATEVEYLLHADPTLNARRTIWSVGADEIDPSR